MNKIRRDHFIGGIKQDTFQVGLGSFFHGLADFLVRGVFCGSDGEIDDTDGGSGNTEGHAREFSLDFRANEADRFRCACRGGNNINGGGAPPFPIFAGRTVDGFLGSGVAVDGGHEAFFHTESLMEKDMNEGGKTVGGTGSIGDDVMLGGFILEMIDSHHNGDVLALGRGGDNDLGAACSEMAFGFIGLGKETRRFDDVVDAKLFPWKGGGSFFHRKALDFMTVDDENVIFDG